jgi:hypothetical protein
VTVHLPLTSRLGKAPLSALFPEPRNFWRHTRRVKDFP